MDNQETPKITRKSPTFRITMWPYKDDWPMSRADYKHHYIGGRFECLNCQKKTSEYDMFDSLAGLLKLISKHKFCVKTGK